mmetsp:Transcript_32032/g.91918  ORF Transcript_32032/g.91918 Transcript_32032/m.91918 type:complete len:396 (-) Transcript_32032:52-1239(-)
MSWTPFGRGIPAICMASMNFLIAIALHSPALTQLTALSPGSAPPPPQPVFFNSGPICIHGKAVPQLYLLGQQKAGTTGLAIQLHRSGVQYAKNSSPRDASFEDKEPDFLLASRICVFSHEPTRNEEDWNGKRQIPGCPQHLGSEFLNRWTGLMTHTCKSAPPHTLADMSAVNFRLPGAPKMLRTIYGDNSSQLRFVICLRQPLRRLHSGFYQMISFKKPIVKGHDLDVPRYMQLLLEQMPEYRARGWKGLERNYLFDQFYRSMYSLNLKPWLKHFHPRQFAIVLKKSMSKPDFRRRTLQQIGESMNMTINPSRFKERKDQKGFYEGIRENVRLTKPRLETDLANGTIAKIQAFFDEDTSLLAELLAEHLGRGLVLGGYTGPASAAPIREFLVSNW